MQSGTSYFYTRSIKSTAADIFIFHLLFMKGIIPFYIKSHFTTTRKIFNIDSRRWDYQRRGQFQVWIFNKRIGGNERVGVTKSMIAMKE